MTEQVLMFECRGSRLIGILHQPAQLAGNIGVVVVVGGPQYRVGSHRQFTLMARALADAGYPVLRFDYRGMGDSAGEYRGFEWIDDDISAAIDALLDAMPELEGVVLWGLCDAASACLIYGSRGDTRLAGMILANPWARTESGEATAYLQHYYLQRLLQRSFWAKLFSGAFSITRSLRELMATVRQSRQSKAEDQQPTGHFIDRMRQGFRKLERPVLLLISERDLTAQEFMGLVAAQPQWRELLQQPEVEQVLCAGSDHTFSAIPDLHWANKKCIEWLKRSIGKKV